MENTARLKQHFKIKLQTFERISVSHYVRDQQQED